MVVALDNPSASKFRAATNCNAGASSSVTMSVTGALWATRWPDVDVVAKALSSAVCGPSTWLSSTAATGKLTEA